MTGRFELIVFDWDGTLMDSAAAIVRAIQAASLDLGQPAPTPEAARQVIGLGLGEALQAAVPGLPADDYPRMIERYRHHYLARDHELALFAGVEVMLAELARRGPTLAVATGKSRLGLDRALEHSGLRPYFLALRTADQCRSKPHPEMLETLMQEFGVTPERTLMIGDTTHDLQMAANAGAAAVGVSYGAHPAAALRACQPLACLDSVAELDDWLRRHA